MAAALGFALTQSALSALLIFVGAGPGLCAAVPAAGRVAAGAVLPAQARPLDAALKQFLAFPMYAAAAWLVWVLAQEAGPQRRRHHAGGD